MRNRITVADLEAVCARINKVTDSPAEPYTKVGEKYKSNPGNFHLSGAYGGWRLERMSEGGGSSDVVNTGYTTKRDLYNRMQAYLSGLYERIDNGI